MEQLGRRVAEWRASLLDKGLKVNAGMSEVMVGSSGRQMIENSGNWLCDVCGKCTNSVYKSRFTSRTMVYVVTCRW